MKIIIHRAIFHRSNKVFRNYFAKNSKHTSSLSDKEKLRDKIQAHLTGNYFPSKDTHKCNFQRLTLPLRVYRQVCANENEVKVKMRRASRCVIAGSQCIIHIQSCWRFICCRRTRIMRDAGSEPRRGITHTRSHKCTRAQYRIKPKDIEPHARKQEATKRSHSGRARRPLQHPKSLSLIRNAHRAFHAIMFMQIRYGFSVCLAFECHSSRNLWLRSYLIPSDNNFLVSQCNYVFCNVTQAC